PNGIPATDNMPYQVLVHVPVLLNNKQAPPAPPNRFQIEVQVKDAVVTCDLGNHDAGMPKTRMYTYAIPNFEPFEGFLGMTASTGGAWQNQIVHSVKIEDISQLCLFPPADVRRKLSNDSRSDKLPVYNQGDTLSVSITAQN